MEECSRDKEWCETVVDFLEFFAVSDSYDVTTFLLVYYKGRREQRPAPGKDNHLSSARDDAVSCHRLELPQYK